MCSHGHSFGIFFHGPRSTSYAKSGESAGLWPLLTKSSLQTLCSLQTSYEGWTYRPPPAVDEDLQDESQSTGDKKVAMEKAPSASGTRIRQRSVSKGSTTEIDHSDAAESHASDDKSDDDSDDNGASCRPRLTNPSPNVLPWKFNQGTSWKNASEVLFPDTFWAQQKQRQ